MGRVQTVELLAWLRPATGCSFTTAVLRPSETRRIDGRPETAGAGRSGTLRCHGPARHWAASGPAPSARPRPDEAAEEVATEGADQKTKTRSSVLAERWLSLAAGRAHRPGMGGRRGWRAGWAPPAVAGAAVALAGLIGGARALLWSDTPVMEVDADWFRCVELPSQGWRRGQPPLPSRPGRLLFWDPGPYGGLQTPSRDSS